MIGFSAPPVARSCSLEEYGLAFSRARTFGLAALRGKRVELGGSDAGALKDVVVGPSGVLVEVIVAADGSERRVPFDETVRFGPQSRSAA